MRRLTLGACALLASIECLVACASRPASLVVPQVARVAQPGSLTVPIRFPQLGARSVQYNYSNGYINAIEVMVVDSLGNHQAFLICRNPSSTGTPGGQVNVLFQNVAPGTAWVTVRTTYKQFIGQGLVLAPVSGSPSTFSLNGGPTNVTAVQGDITTPVLVFKSSDLGGTASAPSVLSFYQNNATSELNDVSATNGGYGVGAATGSVVANNTATVSIVVTQPPAFASSVLGTTRPIDAGNSVTLPVNNLYPGDRVVVVRASNPSATSDFVDLTNPSYDFYPLTDNGDGTATFTPTRSTDGSPVNYYLSRGETASLIGAGNGSVALAQINVHPSVVSAANSTIRIGSDDGVSPLARQAGSADTVTLTLRDQFNNLITNNDFGARTMASFVWRPTVEPSSTALNNNNPNAPNYLAFVPGTTIGSVTTPTYNPVSKTWTATFNQGATPPTTRGASASFTLGSTTSISAVSYLYDPSNATGSTTYTLGVANDPTITNVPQRLWLSLYRGTKLASHFIASASYQPATPVVAGATISFIPSAPSGPPLILRLGTAGGTDLAAADDGTTITPTLGARTAADQDRVVFRLYKQNPDGSLTLRGSLIGGTYTWQQ